MKEDLMLAMPFERKLHYKDASDMIIGYKFFRIYENSIIKSIFKTLLIRKGKQVRIMPKYWR